MNNFKEYEATALRLLTAQVIPASQIDVILAECEFISYDYTGCGYFLEVAHPELPQARVVCHKPLVMGTADSMYCGFVVFIENRTLTLECHSFGDKEVSADFRDKVVSLSVS
jgi:hypothetical protein